MAIAVETLGTLERRITLSIPLAEVQTEIDKRLKARARVTKAPGFRPGKVPLKMIAAQFGYQIEGEVLNERLGRVFSDAAREHQLHVVGAPKIEAKNQGAAEGHIEFDATFEVFPEVKIGDLSAVEIEKLATTVTEAEIDKTIEILRKQRVHYHVKGEAGEHGDGVAAGAVVAQAGDRVTLDFTGTIDGVEFPGGKAEGFVFVLGEGSMLAEFEAATTGMAVDENKVFPLAFPEDYHGKDVAGKTAEFSITVRRIEWAHLPEVDADFAKSLGVEDGNLEKMREDIKLNLGREVAARIKARNKESVMDALIGACSLEVPKALLEQEVMRLSEATRQDMAQRGMKVKDVQFPPELFMVKADRRVRLGLILSEVVHANKLQPDVDQVRAQVEDFSQSYEDPREVLNYYYNDRNRLAEVEALVLEENVVNYVLSQAKVTEKVVAFDELMGNTTQA